MDADLPTEVTDMVRRLALKLAWRCKRDPDDLIQEGLLAAWLELPKFDPSRGVKLTSFLSARVHGAMIDYMRHKDTGGVIHLPRSAKVRPRTASLDKPLIRHDEDGDTCAENVTDTHDDIADADMLDWFEHAEELGRNPRRREFAKLYFVDGLNQREIAAVFGLSIGWASQEMEALLDAVRRRMAS